MHMIPTSQKRELRHTEAKETAVLAANSPDSAGYSKDMTKCAKHLIQHLVCVKEQMIMLV